MAIINLSSSLLRTIFTALLTAFGFILIFFITAPKLFSSVASADVPDLKCYGSACGQGRYDNCPPIGVGGGDFNGGDGDVGSYADVDGDGYSDAPTSDPEGSPDTYGGRTTNGPGEGTGGGSSVICTEMFRQGLLDPAWYEADEEFGAMVKTNVRVGYWFWARPTVRLMQRSSSVTTIVALVAKPWAKQMAYEMGVSSEGSYFGSCIMQVGMPICALLGNLVLLVSPDKAKLVLK